MRCLGRLGSVAVVRVADAKGRYWWAPPLTRDVLGRSRALGAKLGAEFGGKPLKELAAKFVQQEAGKPGLRPGALALRRALQQLTADATVRSSQASLDRLLRELEDTSREPTLHHSLGGKLASKASLLAKELEHQRAEDAQKVQASILAAESLVNEGSAGTSQEVFLATCQRRARPKQHGYPPSLGAMKAVEDFRRRLAPLGESPAQAWFRHCDLDRRGLGFPTFCQRLAALDLGPMDLAELWSQVAGPDGNATVLEVDPPRAEELRRIGEWCALPQGAVGAAGPLGSGLYLRPGGAGMKEDFFTLETDSRERRKLDKQWEQALGKKTAGDLAQSAARKERSAEQNATQLLYSLAKQSTWLGGKHWKSGSMPELLPEEAELLKAPKARKPVARLEIKRVVRPKLEVDREPPLPEKHQKQTRVLYEQRYASCVQEPMAPHWNQKPRRRTKLHLGQDQRLFEHYERTLQNPASSANLPRFNSLVSALMAEEPSSSIQEVSPRLVAADLARLWELVAGGLLYTVRVGQVARAQRCLAELQEHSHDAAAALHSQAVAAQLGEERHFIEPRGSEVSYDPRLLVFEFLCNIMLRKSQVHLVRAFASSAEAGRSVCQQMLMGEGKTTVIAPLLVLLLADGRRLVAACMPAALLDMSRAVMVERFSSPVLPRPVLTLEFHRQVPATKALLAKLEAARQGRAAVIAAPASVKSVLLRRIELLLELHHSTAQHLARSESEKGSWLRLPSWLSTASNEDDVEVARSTVQDQSKVDEACVCGEVLHLFHGGVMLLDEVDLLLDPLRSELNWPLGRRFSLDMAGHGLLRNRALCPRGFRVATPTPHWAPWAERGLAEKIKQGRKSLKVQVTPHFVLLSRDFYMQEMLPHLADWAALFVDEHLEGKLLPADLRLLLRTGGDARIQQLLCSASGPALQALNLSLLWLHQLLPYLLSKVHRVSYGLLTGHDLDTAFEKRTPLSRKLLAVPFVGKDTPSSSSEFSHPDVAIGFTILSYRLNGLRERDVLTLLKVLLDEMKSESTVSFHRRAACQAYVAMVVRAGGRVRGFTEDGRWVGDAKEKRRSEWKSPRKTPSSGASDSTGSERRRNVWPLELLDIADPEQIQVVSEVLRNSPVAIRHLPSPEVS
ncbi:unnamed protein product [Effrenium voratum]|nr:unnamed protein product [Effrenium voratum]